MHNDRGLNDKSITEKKQQQKNKRIEQNVERRLQVYRISIQLN